MAFEIDTHDDEFVMDDDFEEPVLRSVFTAGRWSYIFLY